MQKQNKILLLQMWTYIIIIKIIKLAHDYLKHSPQSKFVKIMKSDALEELNDKKQ